MLYAMSIRSKLTARFSYKAEPLKNAYVGLMYNYGISVCVCVCVFMVYKQVYYYKRLLL